MPGVEMSAHDFRELFRAVSNWDRWNDDGERGAVNHLTPARIAAAARLVRTGTVFLGSDGTNDTAPSTTDGVAFPIHVLTLNAMGVHLFDYLQIEDVARHCESVGRWEFLFVAAPLRIPRGTGSPVNPTAIF
jgi:kynurenine formamidase